jgi:hypothetical protein
MPTDSRLCDAVGLAFLLLCGCGAGWSQDFSPAARWQHYVHRTFSWQRMAFLAGDTAIDQCLGSPSQWDRRPSSFGVRYSAAFGRRLVNNTIELGAGLALHEDARFKVSGRRGFRSRLIYALAGSVAGEDSAGHRRFAYSRLIATVGGNALSATWYPGSRTPGRFGAAIGDGYLGHLQNSLLTEFGPDLARVGKRIRRRVLAR